MRVDSKHSVCAGRLRFLRTLPSLCLMFRLKSAHEIRRSRDSRFGDPGVPLDAALSDHVRGLHGIGNSQDHPSCARDARCRRKCSQFHGRRFRSQFPIPKKLSRRFRTPLPTEETPTIQIRKVCPRSGNHLRLCVLHGGHQVSGRCDRSMQRRWPVLYGVYLAIMNPGDKVVYFGPVVAERRILVDHAG